MIEKANLNHKILKNEVYCRFYLRDFNNELNSTIEFEERIRIDRFSHDFTIKN